MPALADVSKDVKAHVDRLLQQRLRVSDNFFEAEAERLAYLCHRMAERFSRGGRLIACGATPAACSDARHVAVEFVHPVIVGKRALPAIGLTGDARTLLLQVDLLVEPPDMLIAFGADDDDAAQASQVGHAIHLARQRGALTIAFAPAGAEWEFAPPSPDPFVRQELVETLYHVLWELVHVFFEHRGLLEGRTAEAVHDAGGSSFLYPFLAQQEHDLDAVLADVRQSVVRKAQDTASLRETTIHAARDTLADAARVVRAALDAGGVLHAFGNGGSATDAMDLVADLHAPPQGLRPRRALNLADDPAILTALGNDIGPDVVFARQIIAYARPGDVVVAFSTSGDSRNVIRALEEARSRGVPSIAFVGYDGGRIAHVAAADYVVTAPSQHIPRIQEAHATGYHILREIMEAANLSPR